MQKLALMSLVIGGMALIPGLAQAKTGFEFGGRLGYGIPLGKVADGDNSDLNEAILGQVPIWFDAGARISPAFFFGGYFGLGVGIAGDTMKDLCDGAEAVGADCSVTALDLRLGLQAHYHFMPSESTDPWVGAGIGYEIAGWGYELESGNREADVTITASGFEFFNLQGGVDFQLSEKAALGPFIGFSLGQFSDVSSDCSGDCGDSDGSSADIDDKALHQWIFLGARVTILP
jgi:hypothetical protein